MATHSSASLPSIRSLLVQVGLAFAARWPAFVGMTLLSFVPVVIFALSVPLYSATQTFLVGIEPASAGAWVRAVLFGVRFSFVALWAVAAAGLALLSFPALYGQLVLLKGLTRNMGMLAAYREALGLLRPALLSAALVSVAVVTGIVLLILPGAAVVVWASFVLAVVVFEGVGGVAAVRRSVALIRGFFWGVALRWLAWSAAVVAVQAALGALADALLRLPIAPLAAVGLSLGARCVLLIWNVVAISGWLIFQYVLYVHLRTLKQKNPDARERLSPGVQVLLWLLVAIGFVFCAVAFQRQFGWMPTPASLS